MSPYLRGTTRGAALVAVSLVCAWAALRSRPLPVPGPLVGGGVRPSTPSAPPWYHEEILPYGGQPVTHVASLAELADGRLAAVWYAGSKECAPDVEILFTTQRNPPATGWETPRPLVTAATAAAELERHVRKVGNAVLFTDLEGRLWLVYVTIPFGGWSVSSLNVKISTDGGASWSRSRRLTTNPLLNLGTLVKNKPMLLAEGGVVLPINHELLSRSAQLLWLEQKPGGELAWWLSPIGGEGSYLQAALVAVDQQRALALLRSTDGKVGRSLSGDGGRTWSRPAPTSLANPDSGLDAALLGDGRILVACNDDPVSRRRLHLAVSDDLGATWRRAATVADDPRASFSYPFLLVGRDGAVHLLFAAEGIGIVHASFNQTWLDGRLGEAP